jgi:epoxyqueuosine reductase QueG
LVAFFIPFHKSVILSNKDGPDASTLWAEAYIATNALIARASDAAAAVLLRAGYQAAIVPATHNFDESTLMSRWSHRHVAWIAGLGDFGMNNMLITSQGSAGRFGSFVTDVLFPGAAGAGSGAPLATNARGASARADAGPRNGDARRPDHPCLYLRDSSCGLCVARCPTGALRLDGFDRNACYALCLQNAELHRDLGLADVCGKCVSGVPCAFRE